MAAQLQIFMTNPASYRLQGNVEFMRKFGRGGGGGEKNNLFRGVSTLLRRTYVRFDKESHGSSIHPDLNMSEFSKLAIGKSFLGKVVRFFYSFTLRRMGRTAPFYEGYLFCFFWGGEEISKKQLPSSLHYRSSQAFVEKMFVFLWKVKALTPVAQILVPRQSSIFWKKGENTFQPSAFCHFLTL